MSRSGSPQGKGAFAPSQLAGLKYFVAALIASFTLESIGVGIHQTVHDRIQHFYSFSLVLEGFKGLPFTQLFLSFYLVLTLIRYLAAMLVASPLFDPNGGTASDSRRRVLVALCDTLFLYLSLTLLFIASLSAQDSITAIETAIWIILTLSADAAICLLWILALRRQADSIGFAATDAANTREFNKRWLFITLGEMMLWFAFIKIEQNGGRDFDRALVFLSLFLILVADFWASRKFWVQLIAGGMRKESASNNEKQ